MFQLRRYQFRGLGCLRAASTQYTEIKIPVSWGHIAAKWWGPLDKRPIVAVHGIQDNSGSFDTLIPFLPKDSSFLCLDLPGQGFSSWLPKGQFYHQMDNIILLKRLQDYFGWKKISLLGHSNAGIFSIYFSLIFPSYVDFVISLDGYPYIETKMYKDYQKSILNFLRFEQFDPKVERRSYSMKELAVIWNKASGYSVPVKQTHHILKRNIKPSTGNPNTFVFTIDPRLKCTHLSFWFREAIIHYARQTSFPVFCLQGRESPYIDHLPRLYKLGEEMNGNLETYLGEGKHHAHLTHPQEYSRVIAEFIKKHDKESRKGSGIEKVTVVGEYPAAS